MSLPQVPALEPIINTMQPYFVAMIIDGKVYDVMNVDGTQAAKYLAQPTFVQVEMGQVALGYRYDGTTFSLPE